MGLVDADCTNCCENVRIANLSEPTVWLSFAKTLERLAVTYLKNDRMDQHGVNPNLSIFLPCSYSRLGHYGSTRERSPYTLPSIHWFYQMENWDRAFKKFARYTSKSKSECKKGYPLTSFSRDRVDGNKYQLSFEKNYLYSDFVLYLTFEFCKSSVISENSHHITHYNHYRVTYIVWEVARVESDPDPPK